ncbi:MAG TPA: hypothetical protein VF183_17015 [Acidimicrobiales bacterium]
MPPTATPISSRSEPVHEWVSFEDDDGDTYVFDVTFLTSSWRCIYGEGCLGVLDGPAPELMQGCCSYGAHFSDKDDARRVRKAAARLTKANWQFKKEARKLGGAIYVNDDGETVTRLVDDACIFLNRPGFPGGPGCALHRAALEAGERPLDWKPEVCWQLPLRLESHTDDNDHTTFTLREWKRRDWGDGGHEFHWWCTDDPLAFRDSRPVYVTARDEIIELVGEEMYERFVAYVRDRGGTEAFLPHPVLRRRRGRRAARAIYA